MTDCVHLVDFCRYMYTGRKHQRRGVRYQCCIWWHPFVKYSIEALTLLHCLMHGVLKTNWTRESCPTTLIFWPTFPNASGEDWCSHVTEHLRNLSVTVKWHFR